MHVESGTSRMTGIPRLGRIPIVDVAPVVGCGRWPAKAVVGETVEVSATVFR
ncbi:maltotransferase domain-containing protein, partial [Spirillospora sp. NPDC127506]